MSYRHTEVRHSSPLSYVAEKMRNCIESAHATLRSAHLVPEDIELPDSYPSTFSVKADVVVAGAYRVLSDGLKAYLALYDEPERWSTELVLRLSESSREDLKKFLDGVEGAGSLTGRHWPTSDELEE